MILLVPIAGIGHCTVSPVSDTASFKFRRLFLRYDWFALNIKKQTYGLSHFWLINNTGK